MKKQYMQPATLLTIVAMRQMLCGESLPVEGTENDKNNLLSRRRGRRRHDEWDDEEEEEGF